MTINQEVVIGSNVTIGNATVIGQGVRVEACGEISDFSVIPARTTVEGTCPGGPDCDNPGPYADMHNCDLTGADLSYADLSSAVLSGAILTGAVWLNTTCPDSSNSNDDDGDGFTCLNNLSF